MSKSIYILILLLISVSFWNVRPIGRFMTQDVSLILFLLWALYGYLKYRPINYKLLCNAKYNKPIVLIGVAVLISFIPAYWFYGQSFFQSIVVNRQLLSYLSLPLLLAIRPSFAELKKALYGFAYFYAAVITIDSIFSIPIIDRNLQSNIYDIEKTLISEGDYVRMIEGVEFIALAFFFSLGDLKKIANLKTLLLSTFFIFIIFLVQNRSTLFPCALLYVLTVFRIKGGKYVYLIKSGLVVLLIAMISYTAAQWMALFEETQTQLLDEDYNRVKAYTYFLTQYSPHWICSVIGNGFISARSSSIMQTLMAMGIYNSDVGLVGFWNHFGLLPVVVIISLILKSFSRKMSYVVKCNAFFLLACSFTIAYFVNIEYILWLCIFIYMYSYNKLSNALKTNSSYEI